VLFIILTAAAFFVAFWANPGTPSISVAPAAAEQMSVLPHTRPEPRAFRPTEDVPAEQSHQAVAAPVVRRSHPAAVVPSTPATPEQPTPMSTPAPPSGAPQQAALAMLGGYGWDSGQFGCLQSLWDRESGWNPFASNPNSGAYGIPQALPGSKMASAGADWQTNPLTQIRWGLGYIQQVYGSPCAAWNHEQAAGWY
jgi:hypothetical protein